MTTPLSLPRLSWSFVAIAGLLAAGTWLGRPAPAAECGGGIIEVEILSPPDDIRPQLSDLTREDIRVGMRPIRELAQACYDRFHESGLANVEVEISAEGTVTRAIVHDHFARTLTGACVEGAVHHALFRPSRTTTNINYPFLLGPPERSDAASEKILSEARDAYVHGNYAEAIRIAKKAVTAQPTQAWRLIGASSCFLHDRDGAMRARDHLDAQGHAFLFYVCGRSSVTLPR